MRQNGIYVLEWISVQNIVLLNHSKPLLFKCNIFAVGAIKKNAAKQMNMIPKKNVAIYLVIFIVNVKWLDYFRVEPVQYNNGKRIRDYVRNGNDETGLSVICLCVPFLHFSDTLEENLRKRNLQGISHLETNRHC